MKLPRRKITVLTIAMLLFSLGITVFSFESSTEPRITTSFQLKNGRLINKVTIYSKDGKVTKKAHLIDGRWNLNQIREKLGLNLTERQTTQLKACIGEISCKGAGKDRGTVTKATGSLVLRSDLIVTSRHVFLNSDMQAVEVNLASCTFRTYLNPKHLIPLLISRDKVIPQIMGDYLWANDFTFGHLKEEIKECEPLSLPRVEDVPTADYYTFDKPVDVLNVTRAYQEGLLNHLSNHDLIVARGQIMYSAPALGSQHQFYSGQVDTEHGASGSPIFVIDAQGNLKMDQTGRLIALAIVRGSDEKGKDGYPYEPDNNWTGFVGLDGEYAESLMEEADKLDSR